MLKLYVSNACNMAKAIKNRASKKAYVSHRQLTFVNFESPFTRHLPKTNRWVELAASIPWDDIIGVYRKQLNNFATGASNINPRVAIGALMVKHLLNTSDRDTITAIEENIYIQHFLGFDNIIFEEPFNASLFVEIRKRMGLENVEKVNDLIYTHSLLQMKKAADAKNKKKDDVDGGSKSEKDVASSSTTSMPASESTKEVITHSGKLLIDATACPQNIAYPTDLKLLNTCREVTEKLIDKLYDPTLHGDTKPRTYREQARHRYLLISKKKVRRRKELRKALGQQLRYVRRNLGTIDRLLFCYEKSPLKVRDAQYLETIRKIYAQQLEMYNGRTHRVTDRIVSLYQPHVRPIVRGKERANVEFGSKINVSLINGYSFIDRLSWDAFNEGSYLMESIDKYKIRHGYYPASVSVDRIYCTRENRRQLKELGIDLIGRQLGRPPKSGKLKLDPGERNPIEGKFGQGKTKYGLGLIKARLQGTSESWVSMIILVMNLVRMGAKSSLLFFVLLIERIADVIEQTIAGIEAGGRVGYPPENRFSVTY